MLHSQLVIFKVVAETKNISTAAKRLHMSQPAISLQIQSLENEVGVKLFERSNKGVRLTKAGEIFYQKVQDIIDKIHEAYELARDAGGESKGKLYIGATLTIGEYVLPKLLAYFYKLYPEIEMRVKIANTDTIYHELVEKTIDIGLIEGPIDDEELKVEKFWEDELVVVVPYHHIWGSKERLPVAELLKERIILREEGSGTRKVLEIALKELGLDLNDLNVTMEFSSTQAIKEVVAAGLGVTIISELTVRRDCDLKMFKKLSILEAPIRRPLSFVLTKSTAHEKQKQLFINLLRNNELVAKLISQDICDYVQPV
ncbi:selenium metabolism-associated LysR family transcriptional regulator [Carboxydothermus ferrireducens]|uniref:DNA-binding transcriptional LysR family regulator n=1 Tax=Carboxydothermus ferrireducens DSM 11255 TaxID=1119529 RepID=A0ABX2RCS3_9THEO|nr:selenium metabolism-associated LysR family transcriptional regulator [Carboxydothermus ferrireducens]NYE57868.1 DNA-binding transcriptional LysR family regulator [Carboxydothermus ferrireducens DSM 11255]